MGINEILMENEIETLAHPIKHGICNFTGSRTNFSLPNGDYVDQDYVKELCEMNWLDNNLNYTEKFFESNKKHYPYSDKNGRIHALSVLDLAIAITENNTKACNFLRSVLPIEFQSNLELTIKRLIPQEQHQNP